MDFVLDDTLKRLEPKNLTDEKVDEIATVLSKDLLECYDLKIREIDERYNGDLSGGISVDEIMGLCELERLRGAIDAVISDFLTSVDIALLKSSVEELEKHHDSALPRLSYEDYKKLRESDIIHKLNKGELKELSDLKIMRFFSVEGLAELVGHEVFESHTLESLATLGKLCESLERDDNSESQHLEGPNIVIEEIGF